MTVPWQLPETWSWALFTDVAQVASNLVDPAAYPDEPHIAPNHIESNTGRLLPWSTIAADGVTSSKHRFTTGQVLYSKIRPYLAKAVIAPFDGLCSADMYPIATSLEPRYLHAWMLHPAFTRMAAGEQARTVLPKINKEALSRLPVPVPPKTEQRRIVEALDDHLSRLDVAEHLLRAALTRIDALWRSVLDDSYRQATRRGEIRSVGEVSEVQGGIQKQPKRTAAANPYPFLRVANVTAKGLDLNEIHQIELFDGEEERYLLRKGDLLVVEGNGSPEQIGRASMWSAEIDPCTHQNHLIRVRPGPDLDPKFLETIWNAPVTRAHLMSVASSTSGLYTLSAGKLRSVQIPVPALSVQAQVVAQVERQRESVSRLRSNLSPALAHAAALRRSLLEAAFSGRLVSQDPDDEPASVLLEQIAAFSAVAGPARRRPAARN